MKSERARIILGIGEALWDLLPDGKQLGGAPANFAYHAHVLGAEAWPLTRVGNDADGMEILERLQQSGLPTDHIQIDPDAPTGTVSVEILPEGQHRFTIHENVAWDRLVASDAALALAAGADAICFGTLGQRCEPARSTIQALVQATPPSSLRIIDINLRQHYYSRDVIERSLALANMLKINDEELPVVAALFGVEGEPEAQIEVIARRFHLQLVALTCGAEGSVLCADGKLSRTPGLPVNVADTIGAGDAFTAAMALGWLAGWGLDEIHRGASRVAAYVCSQHGAMPTLPDTLKALFTEV